MSFNRTPAPLRGSECRGWMSNFDRLSPPGGAHLVGDPAPRGWRSTTTTARQVRHEAQTKADLSHRRFSSVRAAPGRAMPTMRMTSESGLRRRGVLGRGRKLRRHRIGQQIDRGDDGQEIDDAPPPDRTSDHVLLGLFAVTRGAGAFIFWSVRPDRQVVRRDDPLVIGQDLIGRRQCDRRIEMRVDTDPLEHAFMDLRDRDLHAIPLVGGKFRVRKRGHAPWPVSVVTAQSVSRIVDAGRPCPGSIVPA